jgi:hypothetical protein
MNFYVLEGAHMDPNDLTTIIQSKQRIHGPMLRGQADSLARQFDEEIKNTLLMK